MKTFLLYLEGFRIAVRSLQANRLRTVLTMLGIAIGIFAITIIFTLVNSLNHNLNKNLNKLGNSALFVMHFPWSGESFNKWQKYYLRPKVSFNEFLKLKKNLENVQGVSYEVVLKSQTLKYRNQTVEGVGLRCITQDYIDLHDLDIDQGRPFSDLESDAGRPVCMLGFNVCQRLFGEVTPIGRKIRLKGKQVLVTGTVPKTGSDIFGNSPDDLIFIPYTFGSRIFDMKIRWLNKSIMVKAADTRYLDQVESDIVGLMRASRNLRPKTENNFSVNRPEMLIQVFGDVTDYLWYGGLFISFFAVVVGGFGIGNIMFTTVKERTFEIGLQKSLGAQRNFILFQFLMESVLLCLFGGLVGLALNFGVASLMQMAISASETDFEIVVSSGSILFGIVLSVVIGLGSGLAPSLIAARLDPVESMRQ